MIEKEQDLLVREYDYNLRSQGLSLDMLVKYTGMKIEDIRARYAEPAKVNVLKQLALEEIIKAEKIEASDEEIENKYEEMAKQFGMKADDVKARISKEDLAEDVKSIKAFEFVKDNAKITEKTVTAEEFAKMNAPEEAKTEDGEEKPKKKTARKTAKKTDAEADTAKEEKTETVKKPRKTAAKKTAEKKDEE